MASAAATASNTAGLGVATRHRPVGLDPLDPPALGAEALGDGGGRQVATGNRTRRPAAPSAGSPRPGPGRCARPGTRSGSTPARRRASAVAGPTAATPHAPSARASRTLAINRSTAFCEVSTTQSNGRASAAAAAAAPPRRRPPRPCAVSGSSRHGARPLRARPPSPSARAPARVTTTVRPARGPRSRRADPRPRGRPPGRSTMTAGAPGRPPAKPAKRRADDPLAGQRSLARSRPPACRATFRPAPAPRRSRPGSSSP